MAVNLAPIGNGFQFFTNNGAPLNAGKIYTYQAGSSTPLATYTTNSGLVANTNPIILGTDGRPANQIWLTDGFFYKFILKDSDDVTIQTYDNLYGIIGTAPTPPTPLPSGAILLWSGSIGSIPVGYYLCNGSNGTPDLRDRFIVGAGSTYAVDATGGSADSIVVSHTHTATSAVTDPGHTHTLSPANRQVYNTGVSSTAGLASGGETFTQLTMSSATTGITVATTVNTAGSSGTNANLPPYYALCYIMKS
jgi:microcystin-dependent protein